MDRKEKRFGETEEQQRTRFQIELEFVQCLAKPNYLNFLAQQLLQYEHFRKELVNSQCAKFIDDQQLLHWQHYQRKRNALIQEQAEKTQTQKDGKQVSIQSRT
ncbi:mediator of RNA polymerase II transcription subunit 31-like [Physella acuta]|uniref:mediator of RNA polymerase II transcription subunit 31-like n=1 Tax=Physella acuta TaxID=109671 RepID=UPI0027DCDE71|nr:mediator of RNA polymerase II transcription subunit 31-like [Physella acuta]